MSSPLLNAHASTIPNCPHLPPSFSPTGIESLVRLLNVAHTSFFDWKLGETDVGFEDCKVTMLCLFTPVNMNFVDFQSRVGLTFASSSVSLGSTRTSLPGTQFAGVRVLYIANHTCQRKRLTMLSERGWGPRWVVGPSATGGLETIHCSKDFGSVEADFVGIVEIKPDFLVRANDKDCAALKTCTLGNIVVFVEIMNVALVQTMPSLISIF